MVRELAVAGLVVVAVVAPASASVWGFRLSADHPRDPAAFVRDVRLSLTAAENDPAGPDYVAGDVLLAEGEQACRWLGDQPVALWRGSARFQDAGLVARYRAEATPVPGPAVAPPETTAQVAWSTLCGTVWEVRRPHRLGSLFAPASD